MDPKERAARSAVAVVRSGEVLGLGSGSTSMKALQVLAERMRDEGLRIAGVPTSVATEHEARRLGIPLTTLDERPQLDLALDGADQVDERLSAIKGYGGALLREKIVARCARRLLLMVDESKLSEVLDKPVPVEVLPFGTSAARRGLEALGAQLQLRTAAGKTYVTDNGNHIYDAAFGPIHDPSALARYIAAIPGVIDHGLFVDLVSELHVGGTDSARVVLRGAGS